MLDVLVRAAVDRANRITRALQVDVVHTPYLGKTSSGVAQYGPPTTRQALVDRKRKIFAGAIAMGTATLLEGGIDVSLNDLLTLPNGDVVTVLGANQTLDPNGGAYLLEVFLGPSPSGTV